jgi:hypothetical protein
MMWCPLILAHDVDLEDDGVWQVAFVPGLCSFIFTGGHYSLEDQDVVIAWVTSMGSLQRQWLILRLQQYKFVGSRFGGVAEGVNRCWCKHFPHKEGVLAFRLL